MHMRVLLLLLLLLLLPFVLCCNVLAGIVHLYLPSWVMSLTVIYMHPRLEATPTAVL